MALHPVNDRFKVKKDSAGPFGNPNSGAETGIVVELPKEIIYLSFHSFAFENSIANVPIMEKVVAFYQQFLGKRIYWETLQDRGRTITEEDGNEYVYLQMTDLLAYSDDVDEKAETVDQVGKAGSFNLS